MATWQHLRSSTANKRPTTSLADGRIAINTNTASPGLFFKDSAGTGIVKVGPVHVGTTAPNSVPAAGGSTGNYLGEQWLDTSVSPAQMKVWNGSTWVGVVADELPVSKLQDGAARQLIQTDAAGTGVEWTSNVDVPGTLDVTSTATFDSIAQYPLGSAGAPTITFTGDNNTGIYSPGADQLAISTGGSGRLFIDASGNVKVGSTDNSNAGGQYITVGAPGSAIGGLQLWSTTTGQSYVQFGDGTASADQYRGYMAYLHADDALTFGTASTERLRITSAGLVGIGTSSPVAPLHVSGSGVFARLTDTQAYSFGTSGPILDFTGNDSSGASILFARLQGSPSNANPDRGFLNILTRVNGVNTSTLQVGTGLAADVFVPNGRLGVGTTSPGSIFDVKPSASSSTLRIEAGTINSDSVRLSAGGTVNTHLEYRGYLGHAWFVDATERARIDSSGRFLVGTSSASDSNALLKVQGNIGGSTGAGWLEIRRGAIPGATNNQLALLSFSDSSGNPYAYIEAYTDATPGTSDYPGRLVFSTTADGASSPTERMRITNNGAALHYAATSVVYAASNSAAGTTDALFVGKYGAGDVLGGTNSFNVYTNGNVVNTNNSYGAISDVKLKENIVDAGSQWDDIRALQIRKYNFKEGQTHTQIGLIAQEVGLVSPGLVSESPDRDAEGNDLGTVTKSVNYSVLYMKAVKALQEAMERIELLEARLDAANL